MPVLSQMTTLLLLYITINILIRIL